jgi:[acyl-carrier-protein] S-malonyltransferase
MTLAILCPGQGHQHAGMLDLLAHSAAAQAVLGDAAVALGANPGDWLRAPDEINRNAIAQPLICVAQLATWRALADHLPRPAIFAGYSVGELASYACAGALDTTALCNLARARVQAMDDACRAHPGKLAAIHGLDRRGLGALCRGRDVWPAIVLDEVGFVVGGRAQAIDEVVATARDRGLRVQRLSVDVPSHTPLLAGAVAPFRAALDASPLGNPSAPVLAGIDASLVRHRDDAIRTLSRQVAATIDWSRGMRTLVERGCRVFVELGPGAALSRVIGDRFPDVDARSVDEFRSLDAVVRWTQGRLS